MSWASSRIRAYWPAQYLGADVKTITEAASVDLSTYDAVIWQKTADLDAMAELKRRGVPQYLDICDPIHWFMPAQARKICEIVSAVVCSTAPLADDFAKFIGAHAVLTYVIPDRLEMKHYPIKREHDFISPARFVWYGLYNNRAGLFGALPMMERLACNGLDVELTIYDDRPDQSIRIGDNLRIYHAAWSLESENAVIASHDIALVPPYPGAWGRLKSNNRTLTAHACGLPATTGEDFGELIDLIKSPSAREGMAKETTDGFEIWKSSDEWREVLNVR
jgi:hypothetical protein